ncbi:hypothetical protein B0H17DRAFT_1090378 [Mycena rosella]|uniref:Uncharacterized protein n=1 Tax=Mycena rosella TaxID=1033263 RepID=A0AAD7CVM1_MYCRO|nr:hypothetical protein B0H17DRAFT_1090378 [Mycena rosella]
MPGRRGIGEVGRKVREATRNRRPVARPMPTQLQTADPASARHPPRVRPGTKRKEEKGMRRLRRCWGDAKSGEVEHKAREATQCRRQQPEGRQR